MSLTKNALLCGWNGVPASATGSADDPAFPSLKLLSDDLFDVWRSAVGSISGVQLDLVLAAPTTVGYALLHGCNLGNSATARLALATLADSTFATPLYDATAAAFDVSALPLNPYTPRWGRTLVRPLATPIANVSRVRWVLTDPSPGIVPPPSPGIPTPGPDNYLRAAIARVGADYWQPAAQPSNAAGVNFDDSWQQAPVVSGEIAALKTLRGHALTFAHASLADEAFLLQLAANLGAHGRLCVVPHPLLPSLFLQEVLWSTFESPNGGGAQISSGAGFVTSTAVAGSQGRLRTVSCAFREVDC